MFYQDWLAGSVSDIRLWLRNGMLTTVLATLFVILTSLPECMMLPASHVGNWTASPRVTVTDKEGDASSTEQPHRTGFHFQPEKNWMNDPNGLMYYKGYYHLFYQYNPEAPIWGNIVWGHAVSTDLLRWHYLEPAMKGDHWYDERGVWSGSATLLEDGSPVLLYTGESVNRTQVQNMAIPANKSDPLLLHWIKVPHNPVVVAPPGYNASEFRDPSTAWQGSDGMWRLLVGANTGKRGVIGTALLFKSQDFYQWQFVNRPLHSVAGTGMWECPDFYPVLIEGIEGLEVSSTQGQPVKHVLKISSDDLKHDYYSVGAYNAENDTYEPAIHQLDTGIGLRYDYGKFYASKSFFDPSTNRRILLGWSNESDSIQEDITKGWSSIQSIPRKVWLDSISSTNLLQWPVREVESLRQNQLVKESVNLPPGSVYHLSEVMGSQLDIEVQFLKPNLTQEPIPPELLAQNAACSTSGAAKRGIFGPFGILVLTTPNLEEQTAVFFSFVHSRRNGWKTIVCSDQSRSSMDNDVDITSYGSFLRVYDNEFTLALRILVDHSVVETFAQGGRTVITSRVYPQRAVNDFATIHLFNNSTRLHVMTQSISVWNMESVQLSNFNTATQRH
nr:beta-fructofuranosidase, soluble isoenzyme I-like [Physcomitrium patens]XP_024363697.1 beta-fructofuranosidase, soluble isoenzyme I-like [Physcomitrium patens]XP_024363698.1 beta-fructofuranosidase, soluble isoenzyme I-like [Physcomitrium patens]|eukprot:XP_024363696.1 beta-fructofuranosidase, soluble isoenzyme I-like [Physcomitrella patens]